MMYRSMLCAVCTLLFWVQGKAGSLSSYEREILATCLVLEAASEGPEGKTAVLNVIMNRAGGDIHKAVSVAVANGQFASMQAVWHQTERDYSALIARAHRDRTYPDAYKLVLALERGEVPDITEGATHFHTVDSEPFWAKHLNYLKTIGAHHFYVEVR